MPLRYSFTNIIMSGIWYGKRKPNMEIFQKKFVEEVSQLAKGFRITVNNFELDCKLIVYGQVADLVAKAGNSVNFILNSGKFGCCCCLHPGQRFDGPGNKRVYPYSSTSYARRAHKDTLTHARLAKDTGEKVFGVKE